MHACVLVLREACFRVARLGLPLKVLAFLLISTRCVDVLNVLHARAVPWLCLPVAVWGLIHCRGSGLRDRICYSSVERFLLFVQPYRQRNRAAYFARLAWSHARKFYKKLAYAGSVFGGGADRVSPNVVILFCFCEYLSRVLDRAWPCLIFSAKRVSRALDCIQVRRFTAPDDDGGVHVVE